MSIHIVKVIFTCPESALFGTSSFLGMISIPSGSVTPSSIFLSPSLWAANLQGSHRISGIKSPDFSMIFPEFSGIFQLWRKAEMTHHPLKNMVFIFKCGLHTTPYSHTFTTNNSTKFMHCSITARIKCVWCTEFFPWFFQKVFSNSLIFPWFWPFFQIPWFFQVWKMLSPFSRFSRFFPDGGNPGRSLRPRR